MVIRYAYLWRSQAERGREEGSKDRPCAIVLAAKRDGGKTTVVVAPITHSPPASQAEAIEVPLLTKQRLGLDEARSWVITNDLNIFEWPGPDIRPISPMRGIAYGFLPASLTNSLVLAVRQQVRQGKGKPVKRT